MNSDRRLLDDGADPFEAALLGSARLDGASANHQRTLAALGLAAGAATGALNTGVAAGAVKAGAAIGATNVGAAAAGKGVSLSALSVAKLLTWVGLGAAGGAVTIAVVHSRSLASPLPRLDPPSGMIAAPPGHPRSRTPTSNEAAESVEPPAPAGEAMLVAPAVSSEPSPERVRLPAARRIGVPGVAAVRRSPYVSDRSAGRVELAPAAAPPEHVEPATPDALLEEVSVVDRARLRLSRGDAAGARQDADEYLARFPNGRLASEATVIRIRAVLLSQGRSAAAPLAESFLQQHPDSPHAPSLRQVFSTPSRAAPDR
jgi:hypothetical protein